MNSWFYSFGQRFTVYQEMCRFFDRWRWKSQHILPYPETKVLMGYNHYTDTRAQMQFEFQEGKKKKKPGKMDECIGKEEGHE